MENPTVGAGLSDGPNLRFSCRNLYKAPPPAKLPRTSRAGGPVPYSVEPIAGKQIPIQFLPSFAGQKTLLGRECTRRAHGSAAKR